MKKAIILLGIFAALPIWALQLKYIGETEIKLDTKFKKTTIGGISALAWGNNRLYALSDDKGGKNEPRFYEFELKIDKKKVTLTPKEVRFIVGLPDENGKKAGMDPEGMARLATGDLLISSEGNNNAKPREMPRIFQVKPDGKWVLDVLVPDQYLPEATGMQTKGTQNNLAFEGLSITPTESSLFTATEGSLTQDVPATPSDKGNLIRILRYEKKDTWKPVQEFAYRMEPLVGNDNGPQVFQGVSEILALSDSKVIVLERGLRISPKELYSNRVTLYMADLSKATNTLDKEKLDEKVIPAEKVKILDFEMDLKSVRKKTVENFEALAWGPTLPDGKKTLLMMTDNNFNKTQKMELVVFAVEGE